MDHGEFGLEGGDEVVEEGLGGGVFDGEVVDGVEEFSGEAGESGVYWDGGVVEPEGGDPDEEVGIAGEEAGGVHFCGEGDDAG